MTRKLLTILVFLLTVTQGAWARDNYTPTKMSTAPTEGPWTFNAVDNGYWGNGWNVWARKFNGMDHSAWDVQSEVDRITYQWQDIDGTGFSMHCKSVKTSQYGVYSTYTHSESVPAYTRKVLTWNYTLRGGSNSYPQNVTLYAHTDLATLKATAVDFTHNYSNKSGSTYHLAHLSQEGNSGKKETSTLTKTFEFDNRSGSSAQTKTWALLLTHVVNNTSSNANNCHQWGSFKNYSYSWATYYYKYVTFNSNGGTGTMSQQTVVNSANLTANAFTREGCTFAGWATSANGDVVYANGAGITATSDSKGPVTLYAKWTFQGSGTENDPYLISSAEVWNFFADQVNAGNSYSGKYFKLTEDITVNKMVGTSSCKFSGTFNGDGHTLTFNITAPGHICAPFRYINGATIKFLIVDGTITGGSYKALAGIAGWTTGTNSIINCWVKATMTSSFSGDSSIGGFVSEINSGTISFTNCLFSGSFNCPSAKCLSGFAGWTANNCTGNYTNCLVKPSSVTCDNDDCATFSRLYLSNGTVNLNKAYYGNNLIVSDYDQGLDGTNMSNEDFLTAFGGGWEIKNNEVVPVMDAYSFTGAGTEQSPYLITSAFDWNNLAFFVNYFGESYSGKYFRLTDNINVTTMVGSGESKPFSGIFDGYGKTLTINVNATEEYSAPFRYIDGTTIKNLHVSGTIATNQKLASGLVGQARGTCAITNCRISVTISSSVNGDGTHAGIVGSYYDGSTVTTIKGCVFDGTFATSNGTTLCGGLIGWAKAGSTTNISNTILAPTAVASGMIENTFYRGSGTVNFNESYFIGTTNLPTNQGTRAYKITAGSYVSISNLGTSTFTFSCSGLTFYPVGFKCGDVYYALSYMPVSLTLSHGSKTGYTFYRYTASSGSLSNPTTDSPTLTMPAGDVTINAQWTANTYTVTFDKQSGTGGSNSITATYDAAMPSATMPTRTGYTFQGYYDATSGGTQYYTANGASARTWNKASNTTLYAQWTENTATLTDGEDLSTLATWAGQTCTVTYLRSFTNGKPSTVCLPFAYAPKTGETFYTFTGITKENGEYIATMTAYSDENLVANTPYLFMPTGSANFSAGGGSASPLTPQSVDFSGTYAIPADLTAGTTTNGDWTFQGTYETVSWTEAPTGIYGFSAQNVDAQGISQGEFVKVGAYVRVKPMRCYLKYKNGSEDYAGARGTRAAAADEQLPETIKVRLIGANGEVTAIGTLHTQTGEVTLDGWYTLDGTRLSGKSTRMGIYVNNGKKYMIK